MIRGMITSPFLPNGSGKIPEIIMVQELMDYQSSTIRLKFISEPHVMVQFRKLPVLSLIIAGPSFLISSLPQEIPMKDIFFQPRTTIMGGLQASIPVNREDFVLKASITDPPLLLAKLFDSMLDSAGIDCMPVILQQQGLKSKSVS